MVIGNKGKNINEGKIIIRVGNRKVCHGIAVKMQSKSHHTQGVGAEIAQIKRILFTIKFKIELNLLEFKKKDSVVFNSNL